jgi:hypothetical protein
MSARFIAWLAIILNALALVPGGAHFFALPNKMMLAEEDYFVSQSVYRGWALFGIVLLAALAANIILAILSRRQGLAFVLNTAAAVCIGATIIIFFMRIYPANQLTNNWTLIPENWAQLRLQWEGSHALNAVITFVALCCVAWAALLPSGARLLPK